MKNRSRSTILFASVAMLALAVSASAQTTAPQTGTQTAAPAKPRTATSLKPGQFATEAEAKDHCAGDTVVWVNTSSKIYHYAGSADYGKTKRGAYMCEKTTAAAGFRVAKNEKKK